MYAATAFIIMEAGEIMLPRLGLPDWTVTFLIILLIAGFPITIILSWIFDVSPQGFVKTELVEEISQQDPGPSPAKRGLKASDVIIGVLFVIVCIFLYPKIFKDDKFEAVLDEEGRLAIAVLPFKNISPDSSNQYILDGIMEAVLDYLIKVENVRVIASTSVEQYRKTTKPISVIGEELNVNYILEGSGQKYAENFRLTTKLSEVKSNTLVWSNPYDREIKEILDVQIEIAQKIVGELQLELTSDDRDVLKTRPTFSDKAYQNYLIAEKFWEIGIPRAIELLEEAIEIDPQFVEAYITLSMVHMARATMYGDSTSWEEVKELARLPLTKALEIDPGHPGAINTMGNYRYWIEWDFKGAEKEFLKATELNGLYQLNYVNLLIQNRRFVQALEVSLKLKDQDPINSQYGMMLSYLFLGEYQKAMEQALGNEGWSGRIYMAMQDYNQAILRFESLVRHWRTPFFMSDLAICYDRVGNRDLANEILNELIEGYNQGEGGSIAFMVGKIYSELGEIESALEWLERSYLNHELEMVWLYAEPAFEILQDNEQFIDLLKRVGFDV